MNAVVDTNVIAYHLLASEPFVDEVEGFWRLVAQPSAPSIWDAELVNVLAMSARQGVATPERSRAALDDAAALGIRSVGNRSLWRTALEIASRTRTSGYDALFIALALREKCALITFDKKLLTSFPDVAKRPGALARRH